MRHNSVPYIVSFAGAVCVVCALFVSASAVFLKDRQDANALLDKQKKALRVSGLVEEGTVLSAKQVGELFDTRISMRLIDLETHDAAAEDLGIDPATYDQLKAARDPALSMKVASNRARVSRIPRYALVYEVYKDEAKTDLDLRVLPVEGMGLWGTLYGFLALDNDGNTIRGLVFYKHIETPGLGAEVDNPLWKALWPGRKAYGEDGVPKIRVIKGRAGTPEETPFEVDGLSGATMTSIGVTNLLRFWLGEEGFGPFLAKLRDERSEV